jgi:hypothetical protein
MRNAAVTSAQSDRTSRPARRAAKRIQVFPASRVKVRDGAWLKMVTAVLVSPVGGPVSAAGAAGCAVVNGRASGYWWG